MHSRTVKPISVSCSCKNSAASSPFITKPSEKSKSRIPYCGYLWREWKDMKRWIGLILAVCILLFGGCGRATEQSECKDAEDDAPTIYSKPLNIILPVFIYFLCHARFINSFAAASVASVILLPPIIRATSRKAGIKWNF